MRRLAQSFPPNKTMTFQPPPGQDPVDPRGAFAPPPAPRGGVGPMPASYGPMPPMPFPPGMMPPMMNPMMMQPPRRRSGWRTFFLVVGILALVVSILFNFALLGSSVMGGGRSTQRLAIVDGDARETIAVIPVKGMILQNTADRFERFMTQAERDPNVKAIVIDVETPGGAVTASDQIYHRIDTFKTAHPSVPVVVSMG